MIEEEREHITFFSLNVVHVNLGEHFKGWLFKESSFFFLVFEILKGAERVLRVVGIACVPACVLVLPQ